MSVTANLKSILGELTGNAQLVDEAGLAGLADEIVEAGHIFFAGSGRSGLAIRGFANRLLHLGRSVSMVGDITSPRSRPGDLLIIGSGSGETESLVALARKAHRSGVRIGLITMDPGSTIGQLADATAVLPGASPKLRNATAITSIQPMGSAFEQLAFLTYDALILELMERLSQTAEEMFPRHADLE